MDWSASGIEHSMRYELVTRKTHEHIKDMSGVQGCTLDFGYYTDLKASGTLEVDECDYVKNSMIRIWYEPLLNGEREHILLGTFFVMSSALTYEYGRYKGMMELASVLAKYTNDVCETDTVLAKGRSAKGWFWSAMKWCGATGTILGDVKDVTFSKANVIQFGKPKLNVLNAIADVLGCKVGVTPSGLVSLEKYVSLLKRPVSYTVPTGDKSVTFRGVEYDDGTGGVVNRVVVKFDNAHGAKENNEEPVIYGIADLEASSPYSFANTGIRITKSYTVNDMSPRTKERANEIAAQNLDANRKPAATWQMKCLYLPFTIGDIIRFRYQDSPQDTGIDIDALVSEISMEIGNTSLVMTCTLKEVRHRYA